MAFLIKYQAIRAFLSAIKRSRWIKNLDPSRGWFYSPYKSDYPLIMDLSAEDFNMQCISVCSIHVIGLFITDIISQVLSH